MHHNLRPQSFWPMRLVSISALMLGGVICSSCGVNLSAVNEFAKESSLISSNQAMLDDTAAQTVLWDAGHHTPPIVDPKSKEFTDTLVVVDSALEALNSYMNVLSQLSTNGVSNVSSDFSTIQTGLQQLNVTDPKVQSGLDATSALTNILLDAALRNDIKKLVVAADKPVAQITTFLADQAQITGDIYIQAVAANNKYWGDLTRRTPEDAKFCERANICQPVNVLANRTRAADNADLNAKAAAADAAAKAFRKIHDDNAALVSNVENLDASALTEMLRTDEPYLLTAIRKLKAI